jgi:hypothetical protein
MKQKTLQEQYNLIKKGKGNAEVFVKDAKRQFPNLIRNAASLNETISSLKHSHIISENMSELSNSQPNWFSIFNKNMEILEEEAKAVEKKTSKEVIDLEEKNFDYKDKKNIDNVFGEQFLKGYYTEMKDPKNTEKTIEEIKEIVAKNLAKDQLFYVKDGQFGERGVGYSNEVPGMKASKSDKMVPVKLKEGKVKKPNTDSKLAEIEKNGKIATLEIQIEALDEMISTKNERLSMISEDENLSELIDKNKIKEMQKEIKLLEKKKVGMEKMYEKMCGKSYSKKEVVGEEMSEEPSPAYLEAKDKAEDRVDNGEEIEDVVKDYPEFKEMLLQDLKGKFGFSEGKSSEEPSPAYLEAKDKAEDRVDAGEEIEDIVNDYPEFKEMLLQDLKGKYGM